MLAARQLLRRSPGVARAAASHTALARRGVLCCSALPPATRPDLLRQAWATGLPLARRALSSQSQPQPHERRRIARGDRVSVALQVFEQGKEELLESVQSVVVVGGEGRSCPLPAPLEARLVGSLVGDAVQVVVPASDTYGKVAQDKIVQVERSELPEECEVGSVLFLREEGSGRDVVARVTAVDDKVATVDLNHPFAGKNLDVRAVVLGVGDQLGRVLVETLVPGDGTTIPNDHDTVVCHYKCYRSGEDELCDSSEGRDPVAFVLGHGEVIPGWEDAVRQMSVGQVARAFVPAQLAYGQVEMGALLPANCDLVFEILLCEVVRA